MMDLSDKGILVVDDDASFREAISQVLTNSGLTRVYQADGASKCLSILNQLGREIYLVLLDLNLPGRSGFEIMGQLGGSHPYSVGVIAITGEYGRERAKEFFKLGSERVVPIDFTTKPFDGPELVRKVQHSLTLIHTSRNDRAWYGAGA